MDNLKKILTKLIKMGCCGIKISFEDEGALLNEIISMRYLTASLNIELSIKIGGCEAKRDINDCINLCSDSIVAPMIESKFSLQKFIDSSEIYKNKKGINIETIQAYNNFDDISNIINKIDYITFGRVDFINSINKHRDFVNSDEVFEYVKNIFIKTKEKNINCYLGGAITSNSKNFILKLNELNIIDKFETRYNIFDVSKINFNNFYEILYTTHLFEIEWLTYIQNRYLSYANKDSARINMIKDRMNSS